jgi:phosphoglycerate dehydrogenase-like enzyme
LWDLPNLVITPHLAGSAGTELRRMGASAVAEVSRIVAGQPLRHQVRAAALATLA